MPRFRCALSLLLLHLLVGTSFADAPDENRAAVEARYRYTVPGFFGDFKAIGSVLVVQKEGLRANRPSALFKPTVITDSRVVASGGGDLPLGGNLDGILKPGDQLHVYGIRSGEDYIDLDLFTVKAFVVTGARGATPLQATTRFQYAGGLGAVGSRQVMKDIAQWFRSEEEIRHAPEARETRTIHMGQTLEEVTAIFGAPEKKLLLGPKAVFVYRDVKVVFIDGKVVDAE